VQAHPDDADGLDDDDAGRSGRAPRGRHLP